MTRDEMNRQNRQIEIVCEQFVGQMPDLCQMVGIIVVGQLFGWRVMRLTCSGRIWSQTIKWFGDPKEWMPDEGRLVRKSVGYKLVQKAGSYWDIVRGSGSREDLPNHLRKEIGDPNLMA